MWDDVIIGKGNAGHAATKVVTLSDSNHSIAQSDVAFWISECILGAGLTIFKNTIEGKELQAMIDANTRVRKIQKWLDHLVLKHLPPEKLYTMIKLAQEQAHQEGRRAKANEFRAVVESN